MASRPTAGDSEFSRRVRPEGGTRTVTAAWWVVPEVILPLVQRQAGLPAKQILVPKPLQPIELHGLRITPFDALHWEDAPDYPDGRRGVPATGYLIELGGKRWLFPGDTRTYNVTQLPHFRPLDVLFAHLWLGRGAALQSHPPLLELFWRFSPGASY